MHFCSPPLGAQRKRQTEEEECPDCVPPFTPIPLSALPGDLLKSSKHPPAFVWSDDLTGMPSCPLESEPKSTLAGITLQQEVGCRDQGWCLHRRSVSRSAERLPDTFHMGKSICAINGGNDINVECL